MTLDKSDTNIDKIAGQTAEQMVKLHMEGTDKKTLSQAAQEEFKVLNSALQSDDLKKSSPQAQSAFIEKVFSDIDATYLYGKDVRMSAAALWTESQSGKELPAAGFSPADLHGVIDDSKAVPLDKYMADQLLKIYPDMRTTTFSYSSMVISFNAYCKDSKERDDQYGQKLFCKSPDADDDMKQAAKGYVPYINPREMRHYANLDITER